MLESYARDAADARRALEQAAAACARVLIEVATVMQASADALAASGTALDSAARREAVSTQNYIAALERALSEQRQPS